MYRIKAYVGNGDKAVHVFDPYIISFQNLTVHCADQNVEREENEGAGRMRNRRSMRKGL
jgi:hypothetical protein